LTSRRRSIPKLLRSDRLVLYRTTIPGATRRVIGAGVQRNIGGKTYRSASAPKLSRTSGPPRLRGRRDVLIRNRSNSAECWLPRRVGADEASCRQGRISFSLRVRGRWRPKARSPAVCGLGLTDTIGTSISCSSLLAVRNVSIRGTASRSTWRVTVEAQSNRDRRGGTSAGSLTWGSSSESARS